MISIAISVALAAALPPTVPPAPAFARAAPGLLAFPVAAGQDPSPPSPPFLAEGDGELNDDITRCLDALRNPEFEAEGRYQASRYLVRYYTSGLRSAPPVVLDATEAFVIGSLEALRGEDTEDVRLCAGAAADLARLVPTERVRALLMEALLVRLDRLPWRRQFFEDLCAIGMTEALPVFEDYVDLHRAPVPDGAEPAEVEYPVGDALMVVARLGGAEQITRIAPFLSPPTSPTIRYHAVDAISHVDDPAAMDALAAAIGEDDPTWLRLRAAQVLTERGSWSGVDRLIQLASTDPRALQNLSWAAGRSFAAAKDARAWRGAFGDRPLDKARVDTMAEEGLAVRWDDRSTVDGLVGLLTAAEVGTELQRAVAWQLFVDRTGVDASSGDFWSLGRGEATPFARRATEGEDAKRLRSRQQGFILEARAWLADRRDQLEWDDERGRFSPVEVQKVR